MNKKRHHPTNFFDMSRDVLIASLNKGQFLVGLGGLIIMAFVLGMESEHKYGIVVELITLFKTYHGWGWGLSGISILGWFFSGKRIRRLHTQEMIRMSDEKTQAQQRLSDRKLPTSNN